MAAASGSRPTAALSRPPATTIFHNASFAGSKSRCSIEVRPSWLPAWLAAHTTEDSFRSHHATENKMVAIFLLGQLTELNLPVASKLLLPVGDIFLSGPKASDRLQKDVLDALQPVWVFLDDMQIPPSEAPCDVIAPPCQGTNVSGIVCSRTSYSAYGSGDQCAKGKPEWCDISRHTHMWTQFGRLVLAHDAMRMRERTQGHAYEWIVRVRTDLSKAPRAFPCNASTWLAVPKRTYFIGTWHGQDASHRVMPKDQFFMAPRSQAGRIFSFPLSFLRCQSRSLNSPACGDAQAMYAECVLKVHLSHCLPGRQVAYAWPWPLDWPSCRAHLHAAGKSARRLSDQA